MTVEFEFNYNSESEEFSLVSQKILSKGKSKSTTKVKTSTTVENEIPLVIREDNKLVFNQKALDLVGIEYGSSVSVQFDKKGKVIIPVIGDSDVTGVKGNKITKTGTLSCRGKTNEVLADYGTTFTLEASSKKGVFNLIGDKNNTEITEEGQDLENDEDVFDEDIDFSTDIDLEEDDKNLEINDFTFN